MDWLEENELIANNPVEGTFLIDESDDSRDPFSIEQLHRIFSSPLYTGARDGAKRLHMPGNVRVRDHRFWLPLLGLWTGARAGELIQLGPAGVHRRDGVSFIDINATGGKALKTSSAKRIVPIHSELVRLGFLQFVEQRRSEGVKRLFPEIKPDTLGRLSSDYSKAFSTYLRRIGVKTDERVSFHSFRHGFADEMRRAGHGDATIAVLLGHSQKTVTAGYGQLTQFGPVERAKLVESVRYEGLDLSHLYPVDG